MSAPVIAFFNSAGGVGKTTLVYHLSHLYADRDIPVLAVDLDPQSDLTSAFLDDERREAIWEKRNGLSTFYDALRPLIRDGGDVPDGGEIVVPKVEAINEYLGLLNGDPAIARFEDALAEAWLLCRDREERAFRLTTAFGRAIRSASESFDAEIVLMDLGPNLGAINRAALIAADFILVPLHVDPLSLLGLENSGPKLRQWRSEWESRRGRNPDPDLPLPFEPMSPLGYLVTRPSVRFDLPLRAYNDWAVRLPGAYRSRVLDQPEATFRLNEDPLCLGVIKHYHGLITLAQEARKPMFMSNYADGAMGSYMSSVQDAYKSFKQFADRIFEILHQTSDHRAESELSIGS